MSTFQFDVGQAVKTADGRRGTIASRSAGAGMQPLYLFKPAGAPPGMRWMPGDQLAADVVTAAPSSADRVEYFALLATHDWEFEFSDDGAVYRRGLAERKRLEALQPAVDPGFAAWNRNAPAAHRREPAGSAA